MKRILLAALLLVSAFAFGQTTITCDSVLQTSTCAGGNVVIPFQYTGTFPFGNVFTAELSDNWGNWGNPLVLGSTMFAFGGNGIIFGTIPASANFGFLYRVRITSSNPVDTSNDSPNTLVITQVAQLNQIISNPGDSACPGDTIALFALNFASSYVWSTGDTTAGIDVTQSGIYSVTTTDALGCESTATDTIVFDPSLCTGIYENESAFSFSLFPNPASGTLHIETEQWLQDDALLNIYDGAGRLVKQFSGDLNTVLRNGVDVSDLNSGVYMVSIHTPGGTTSHRFVKE